MTDSVLLCVKLEWVKESVIDAIVNVNNCVLECEGVCSWVFEAVLESSRDRV